MTNLDSVLLKLEDLKDIKEDIKNILISKGVNVSNKDFSSYPDLVSASITDAKKTDLDKFLTRDFGSFYENSSLTVIPNYIFYNSASETAFSFPNATKIDSMGFGNGSLISISIPKVTSIEHSFPVCRKLKSIYAPLCTSIGKMSITYSNELEVLDFPALQSIEGSAFLGCNHLKKVWLPKSCTSITGKCFTGCYNSMTGTVPTLYVEASSVPSGWDDSYAYLASNLSCNVIFGATRQQFEEA